MFATARRTPLSTVRFLFLLLLALPLMNVMAQQPKPDQDPVDKAGEDRLKQATQDLQMFFDARKSTVRWGTQNRRRVTVGETSRGIATMRFEYVWAESPTGPYWKDVVVEFELSGQDWALANVICRTPVRGPIDRNAKALVQELDLLKVLSEAKGFSYWLNEGRNSNKAGKWDEAVTNLTNAIELEPLGTMAWNERGIAHLRKGRGDRAVADFSKAIELQPTNHILWTNRADAHGKMGEWDRTVADSSKAIELKGDYEIAHLLRGSAHASLGRWEKAADDFARAATFPSTALRATAFTALVQLPRKDARGYREACGRLLDLWKTKEEAKDASEVAWVCSAGSEGGVSLARVIEVLEKNAPTDYTSLRALGAALYRSGKSQQAVEALTRAIDSRKQPAPAAGLLLAMASHQLGKKEEAHAWLDKARAQAEEMRKQAREVAPADGVTLRTPPWNEMLILDLLLREAEQVVMPGGK
jgi:tetratricopeptide (TPR) repeat protein